MQTRLPPTLLETPIGRRADQILRRCVHCGFCNATCPTYLECGDELDGPRGRIYLIKEVLESGSANRVAANHLDRCLTCRACETTCPAGVEYGELAEIGRDALRDSGALKSSWITKLLLVLVRRPNWLRVIMRLGRPVRFLLPTSLRETLAHTPHRGKAIGTDDASVLIMRGCVQCVVTPEVNDHLAGLLDRRGIAFQFSDETRCCGGMELHAGRHHAALNQMQRNIRALNPSAINTVISTATGCGVTLKEYGRLLGSEDGRAFSAKVVDAAEYLQSHTFTKQREDVTRVAWHAPCTLQHGQRLRGVVESILTKTGYELVPVEDAHLCCGSAGVYSIEQPELSRQLRQRKVDSLMANQPQLIATANIGCQMHMGAVADIPVVHWLELLR
ncbi:MAG: glycolate oxidase subunit GlcF [Pseudomonadales bacterium]|nr:glycolate oxidase subunit GlcF [Pseudomonadales bacterium]